MGILPATGTEIKMSCVFDAMGFPLPTFNISLNGTLGFLREPPQVSGTTAQQTRINAGVETQLSEDFGGLNTPDTYTCP